MRAHLLVYLLVMVAPSGEFVRFAKEIDAAYRQGVLLLRSILIPEICFESGGSG